MFSDLELEFVGEVPENIGRTKEGYLIKQGFRLELSATCGLCLFMPSLSHGAGFVRFESSGFLRDSQERSNSVQTISIGPRWKGSNHTLEAEIDVQGIVQTSDRSSLTAEGQNLYLQTSEYLTGPSKVTLGRKKQDWSRMDDAWALGVYSPRFLWDPIRPQKIGLTGAFYQYTYKGYQFTIFGSPLSIPERGFPIRQEGGQLTSSSPFYIPQYSSATLAGSEIPIRYQIQYPQMKQLLVNPNAMVKGRIQNTPGRGFWVQGMYGYLPIHQVNVSVEATYKPVEDIADVTIHPRVLMRHLVTAEAGYESRHIDFWSSATEERPVGQQAPARWNTPAWQPARILASGVTWKIKPEVFHMRTQAIYMTEPNGSRANQTIQVDLPNRFDYQRAGRIGFDYRPSDRFAYSLTQTYDARDLSSLHSLDVNYYKRFGTKQNDPMLALNVGADFFDSKTNEGFVGQFKGNDRVRAGFSYVF